MDAGIFGYLYLAPIIVIFAASAWASALRRSRRAGVQTAVWTALLASLVTYAVAVSEAVRWYALDTSLILASDAVPLERGRGEPAQFHLGPAAVAVLVAAVRHSSARHWLLAHRARSR